MSATLFIISAPSGAGKTTIVNALLHSYQLHEIHPLERIVTYTSKTPRVGEIPGNDFHYVTPQEFERKIDEGFFLEWSTAYQHYYGTPRNMEQKLRDGVSLIAVIDRVGAKKLVTHIPDAVCIWITTPSVEILEQRLRARNTETEAQILHRLARAQQELAEQQNDTLYRYTIINGTLTESIIALQDIIIKHVARSSSV